MWPTEFDHTVGSLAKLKAMTSTLIGRFSSAVAQRTREVAGPGQLTRYAADLCVPAEQRAEVALLKAVSSHFVFHRDGVEPMYRDQRLLLTQLAEALYAGGAEVLHPMFAQAWLEADHDDVRLRIVIDQVASLTDVSAVRWHDHLVGGTTPGRAVGGAT